MHEYSVASQIWESVAKAAREHGGGRVLSVTLEVGVLNLIEEEQLRFWIGMLAERDGSPEAEVEITTLGARVTCNTCGAEGEPGMPEGELDHFVPIPLRCRACGSRHLTVTGGRELRVVSAKIETEGEHGDQGEAGSSGASLDRAQ